MRNSATPSGYIKRCSEPATKTSCAFAKKTGVFDTGTYLTPDLRERVMDHFRAGEASRERK
jgi:hypothetical protein